MESPTLADELTIDALARRVGTTTRSIRSFQTLGLLEHPNLRGRTGLYGPEHRRRLAAILDLQQKGFSLSSLGVLFAAHDRGATLGEVLGLDDAAKVVGGDDDDAVRYGFIELLGPSSVRQTRPLLSIVPTTLMADPQAS